MMLEMRSVQNELLQVRELVGVLVRRECAETKAEIASRRLDRMEQERDQESEAECEATLEEALTNQSKVVKVIVDKWFVDKGFAFASQGESFETFKLPSRHLWIFETLYSRHEIMCCGSLQGRCPRPFGCSPVVNCVKATLNCRVSLVCSTCGQNISLHLFVPVLSHLSLHRENVSGECGGSGCNRLLVRSRLVKFETIQVKLEPIQACAKMQAHENPFDTKKYRRFFLEVRTLRVESHTTELE